ncbi:hypothetical protein PR048_027787 [Dryococelus australis]|uniref:Uncharacterized protein n=1 Tax=Dryococelus australis TaxID=614101 RepID=A0ABQ9GHG2_9NEOP|nr:hypothetical protein PR048_027787 [Dryococelus australis]
MPWGSQLQPPTLTYNGATYHKVNQLLRAIPFAGLLLASYLSELGTVTGRAAPRFFARGTRAGQCHWSVDFCGDRQFPPPLYSGDALSSLCFTFIDSQDLSTSTDVENFLTRYQKLEMQLKEYQLFVTVEVSLQHATGKHLKSYVFSFADCKTPVWHLQIFPLINVPACRLYYSPATGRLHHALRNLCYSYPLPSTTPIELTEGGGTARE